MHVAFSNRMCGSASLEPRHDVVVLENLRFRPPDESPFSKISNFGARKRRLRVDGSRIRRKQSPFSKIPGYAWTGSKKGTAGLY